MDEPGTILYSTEHAIIGDMLALHVSQKEGVDLYVYKCTPKGFVNVLVEKSEYGEPPDDFLERCNINASFVEVFGEFFVSCKGGILSVFNSKAEKLYELKYICNKTIALSSGVYEYMPGELVKVYDYASKARVEEKHHVSLNVNATFLYGYCNMIVVDRYANYPTEYLGSLLISDQGDVLLENGIEKKYFGGTDGKIIIGEFTERHTKATLSFYSCGTKEMGKNHLSLSARGINVANDDGLIKLSNDKECAIININSGETIWKMPSNNTSDRLFFTDKIWVCWKYMKGKGVDVLCNSLGLTYSVIDDETFDAAE